MTQPHKSHKSHTQHTQHQPRTPDGKPEPGEHMLDEADIGSGEKTPGELETEEHIKSIPPLPHGSGKRDLRS